MTPLHKATAVAISALALAALPTVAMADQPFKNCTEAYSQGYANIPKDHPRYGPHLDRDKDGIGCDKPPADFTPATEGESGQAEAESGQAEAEKTASDTSGTDETSLAETGGTSTTPWIAAGGAAVVLAGGGLVAFNRKRRVSS
ncbi:excalibur calcium-binding domain-containing protein [Streptomyces sp. HNM0645]|uniref:excalibur calcium-binding domain-containing protein n=1 Tax=Streptomyces sp. HNM0645 TaxID=2782343 RepID=UPI0024B77CFA|nr:excalibur calcium-binding domain-containing protein [Streptomyces sp. HNM0645]MDI9885887.1 excalibur calcium-binding domain-containing protein [Streptomyces sp. HNM0645]